jgi:hypothetical protein
MQHAVIEINFSMVFSSDEGCHCFVKDQGAPEYHQGTVQHVREDPVANFDSCLSWQGRQEQEALGQHAQEAGGGYCKAECLHLVLRSLLIEKYKK